MHGQQNIRKQNLVLTNIICEIGYLKNLAAELSFSWRQFYTDMGAKCSPETSVSTYNTIRCQTSGTLQSEKFPAMKITWKIVSVFELT